MKKSKNLIKKRFGLSVSFSQEEHDMVEALRKSPHYLNMSEVIRERIREIYEERVEKN